MTAERKIPQRGTCGECLKEECAITAEGNIRFHLTDDEKHQETPGSRKCRGAGKPPAGAQPMGNSGPLCRVCRQPVELTANDRAKTHPALTGEGNCSGGSEFPEGMYPDTAAPVVDGTLESVVTGPGQLPGRRVNALADALEREVQGVGTVLDRLKGDTRELNATPGNGYTGHAPHLCDFEYGDDGKGHSGSFCRICGDEQPELTPEDLIRAMPQEIQTLAEQKPGCGTCGHKVQPLVDRFDLDGSAAVVVWDCGRSTCRGHECSALAPRRPAAPAPVRPPRPEPDCLPLNQLKAGDEFQRKGSWCRVDAVDAAAVAMLSVTALDGKYAGRTGTLPRTGEIVRVRTTEGDPWPVHSSPYKSPQSRPPTQPQQPSSMKTADRTTVPGSTPTGPASAPAAERTSERANSSAPTATAPGSVRSAAVTTDQAQAETFLGGSGRGEDDVERDEYGRYLLPHPESGIKGVWTRATTFAKVLSDTYALNEWSQRMVAKGMSQRQDLVSRAFGLDVRNNKDELNRLCEEAKTHAGSKVAADLGTLVHSLTEHVDRGEDVLLPPAHKEDVRAYVAALRALGLEPVSHLIEFTTCVTQFKMGRGRWATSGVAGTSDRCYRAVRNIEIKLPTRTVTLLAGEYVIGDVKTGHDLDYGWGEICIQLALYAHGLNQAGYFDHRNKRWLDPGLKVREDVGIIAHMPVDKEPRRKGEGRKAPCTLHGIDLDAGWSAAALGQQVRVWQKVKGLAVPLEVAGAAPSSTAVTARPPTWEERFAAVRTRDQANSLYKEAKAAPGMTRDRLDALIAVTRDQLAKLTPGQG